MSNNKVVDFKNLVRTADILSDLIKTATREMITCVIEAKLQEFMAQHVALKNAAGKQQIVRNGFA